MVERTAIVRNANGIHCRPSAVIVREAARFRDAIRVVTDAGETNLRSMVLLVSLGLERGARVHVCASGPDEASCCARIAELFETHFDFSPLAEPGAGARAGAAILGGGDTVERPERPAGEA